LRHGDEFRSLIIEGMIEGTRLRRRHRTKYISQIIQDAGVTSYKANDRETRRKHLLKTNLRIEKSKNKKKNS